MKLSAKIFGLALALSITLTAFCGCNAAAAETRATSLVDGSEFTVTKADGWTNLFFHPNESQKTWLGADGIYSAALNGNDAFGSASSSTTTFFIFSDTLMGTSDDRGHLIENAGMPSTTSAFLKGSSPLDSKITYAYGNGGNGGMGGQNLFGEKLWMLDCLVLGGNIYCFGFHPSNDWKPENMKVAVIPVKSNEPDYSSYVDPVDVSQYLWHRDSTYLYAYGVGIFNNTAEAGAPNPDGYIYLYGYRDAMREMSRKDMIVSRIKANDFPTYTYDPDNKHNYHPDFSSIEYFDGSKWVKDITKSAPLIDTVSCEFSVSPITTGKYTGKYIAIYTHNTESEKICYAIGDSPVGPFKESHIFYKAPEHNQVGTSGYGRRYVYNAKAHPHLSQDGKLLVSYNCNVRDVLTDDQTSADYHPRFLWLDLNSAGGNGEDINSNAVSSSTSSNTVSSESSLTPSQPSQEISSNFVSETSSVESISSEAVTSDGLSSTVSVGNIPSDEVSGTPTDGGDGGGNGNYFWIVTLITGFVAGGIAVYLVSLIKKNK